jgi:hypothetical protein
MVRAGKVHGLENSSSCRSLHGALAPGEQIESQKTQPQELLQMTTHELANQVGKEAAHELADALGKIKHCVDQLDDAKIWSRPQMSLNSIGNLLLHLTGNLTQWIVCGIGGADDHRDRPAEFAERGPIPKSNLIARLESAVVDAGAALERVTGDELVRVRRIQGFDVTGLAAMFQSISHFRGHTQEIVHMTRMILGEQYRIQWQPSTPEQGAAS